MPNPNDVNPTSAQLARKHVAAGARPLHLIAREIRAVWKKPYFGAVPYLDAMATLNTMADEYGCDSADSIVAYFLANAHTWRGGVARYIKAELNAMLKEARTAY